MSNREEYEINFFRPLSAHARGNTKLIATLAIIWAVAVFGFHFILIIVSSPKAEQTLNDFNSVWPQVVEDSTATADAKQVFSKSILMVLGKNIALADDHKAVLKESLSWAVHNLQADSVKALYRQEQTDESVNRAITVIGLKSEGFDKIMGDLLPSSLVPVTNADLSQNAKTALPEIMNLYLVHNQSFLTDFRFMGFPFHYWYTAQFLLILFVVLCLIYAVLIDRLNKKHEVVEET